MRQEAAEIAEAIALQMMVALEGFKESGAGIPIGDVDLLITEVDYDDGEDTVGILLSDGTAWEILPYQVMPTPPTARVNREEEEK